jgi:hypothetical protein
MTTARAALLRYKDDPSYYEITRQELEPVWLAAANERLAEHRASIPVLARVADEAGVAEIRSLNDLVPLLFAHSSYKSYPDTFVSKGRWDLMNQWLDTLSSARVEGVDVDGVRNQDDWIERLRAAGHWDRHQRHHGQELVPAGNGRGSRLLGRAPREGHGTRARTPVTGPGRLRAGP